MPMMRADYTIDPVTGAVSGTGQIIGAYKYLSGREPERVDGTTLKMFPGSAADRSGRVWCTSYYGLVDFTSVGVTVDPSPATGFSPLIGGLDVGPSPSNSGYQLYDLLHDETGELVTVASTAIYYSDVVVPAGCTMVRKSPLALPYSTAWGGIPGYHLSGWPSPIVDLTQGEFRAPFEALSIGTSTDWATVDLSGFMPDGSRYVRLGVRVHPETGTGARNGSAWLRTPSGGQVNGYLVGQTQANSPINCTNEWSLRTTSEHLIEYRIQGGSKLSLYVLGYSMTGRP